MNKQDIISYLKNMIEEIEEHDEDGGKLSIRESLAYFKLIEAVALLEKKDG